MYSIFTYDVLHSVHLGTAFSLNECLMRYLQSNVAYSHLDGAENLWKPVRIVGKAIIQACNYLLGSIQGGSGLPGARVDFHRLDGAGQLSGVFTNASEKNIGRKRSQELGHGFRFVAAFAGRVLDMERTAAMMRVNTKYVKFSNILCRQVERMI